MSASTYAPIPKCSLKHTGVGLRHLRPEWRMQRHFAIVNFWRPVGGPVFDTLLAVCDARTIAPEDLLPVYA